MAKKDKTVKLPKKVGGVKLSKQLRKSAGVMAEIAQSPVAREVVSAALVAGASALARRKTRGQTAPAEAKKAVGNELDALISQGKEVGNMITQGINAFVSALLKPAEKAAETVVKPTAAKPASRQATARQPAAKPATATPAAARSATTRRSSAKPAAKRTAPAKPRTPKPKA